MSMKWMMFIKKKIYIYNVLVLSGLNRIYSSRPQVVGVRIALEAIYCLLEGSGVVWEASETKCNLPALLIWCIRDNDVEEYLVNFT